MPAIHRDLLLTIHTPVAAHGSEVRNAFGVCIATAVNPTLADAIAEMINLGVPGAEALNAAHEAREADRARRFSRYLGAAGPGASTDEVMSMTRDDRD